MPGATRGAGRTAFAIAMSVVSGVLYASQSRVNGQLGLRLDNGFAAAASSFGIGLVVMCAVLAVNRHARRGLGRVLVDVRRGDYPWWGILGGLAGGLFVLTQGLVAGAIGVTLFTVGVVAGQTVSSMLLDTFGGGPGGRIPLTAPRIIGGLVALGAVAVAASGRLGEGAPWVALACTFGIGLALGWQQAVNGRVRVRSGSSATATFLNFLAGTAILLVILAISWPFKQLPVVWPTDLWFYIGGPLGCMFIAIGAWAVRIVGVFVYGLASVGGQLAMALFLDEFVPAGASVDRMLVVGCVGVLLGVGIASLPSPSVRRLRPGRNVGGGR